MYDKCVNNNYETSEMGWMHESKIIYTQHSCYNFLKQNENSDKYDFEKLKDVKIVRPGWQWMLKWNVSERFKFEELWSIQFMLRMEWAIVANEIHVYCLVLKLCALKNKFQTV